MKILNRTNPNLVFGRFWSEYWAKHIEPMVFFRLWFSLPFNGQSDRLAVLYGLANIIKPTHAIESGTYLGTSTYLFLGIPSIVKTVSIESNPKFHFVACERWDRESQSGRLDLELGDSRIVIPKFLSSLNRSDARVICYLDAHWNGDIPTIQEIQFLVEWGGSWVAIIDDFFVPDQNLGEYGFDSYGGIVVGPEILEPNQGYKLFLTKRHASLETGARRGTGYLISENLLGVISNEHLTEMYLEEYYL